MAMSLHANLFAMFFFVFLGLFHFGFSQPLASPSSSPPGSNFTFQFPTFPLPFNFTNNSSQSTNSSSTSNTIAGELSRSGNYSTLISLLSEYELDTLINNSAVPLTLLAPNNAAFDEIPSATFRSLSAENRIRDILAYHVISSYQNYTQLRSISGKSLATLAGINIAIRFVSNQVQVGSDAAGGQSSYITSPDLSESPRLSIQGLNKVLLPPSNASAKSPETSMEVPSEAPSSNSSNKSPPPSPSVPVQVPSSSESNLESSNPSSSSSSPSVSAASTPFKLGTGILLAGLITLFGLL